MPTKREPPTRSKMANDREKKPKTKTENKKRICRSFRNFGLTIFLLVLTHAKVQPQKSPPRFCIYSHQTGAQSHHWLAVSVIKYSKKVPKQAVLTCHLGPFCERTLWQCGWNQTPNMSTSKKSDKTHEQRFRNREHARKTRERKKEQLSNLQGKIRDLFEVSMMMRMTKKFSAIDTHL